MAKRKQTVQALPPAISAATPLTQWSVVVAGPPAVAVEPQPQPVAGRQLQPRRRKGPAPGTVDRYGSPIASSIPKSNG